jgi:hypothetical protein
VNKIIEWFDWLIEHAQDEIDQGQRMGAGESISPATHREVAEYWKREREKLNEIREGFALLKKLDAPLQSFDAIRDINDERNRQIQKELFTPELDDKYQHNELERAAASLAYPPIAFQAVNDDLVWPFHVTWFKRKHDERKRLVHAAALLVAAIDKIDRNATTDGGAK